LILGTIAAGPYCQRACFEGTKKPIGWCSPRSTLCLSAALRRGDGRNLFRHHTTGQSILCGFLKFFHNQYNTLIMNDFSGVNISNSQPDEEDVTPPR
jgi:hypothetical protein